MTEDNTGYPPVAQAAAEAIRRGLQPVPVRDGTKRPLSSAWTHEDHDQGGDLDAVRSAFAGFAQRGASNIGLRLGEPSGGLVDIDLDHPKASRLKDYFLPPTPMRSGRPGRPSSHYWYRVQPGDVVPATRQYKMPDGSVIVELRSTGGQTLIPPSVHPSGEAYRWEGRGHEWKDPAEIRAAVLQVQVAFVALGAVLLDQWPRQGSRHEAYLALAGALLRYGDDVHPWWERNAPRLIRILADASNDEDGADQREKEVMGTTLKRLRGETLQDRVTGWPKLGELIGEAHAERARQVAFEIETLSGFRKGSVTVTVADRRRTRAADGEPAIEAQDDPYSRRETHWNRLDLGPYIRGEIVQQQPTMLRRTDGQGLLYPGRTNMLVAGTESGKTWVALYAALQAIGDGLPVLYIDLEDGAAGTVDRLKALGMGHEDIQHGFTYLNPEQPLASMQQNRWGRHQPSDLGMKNLEGLNKELEAVNPSLVVVDGMSVLYGLHNLDTNDVTGTDVINNWLKSLVLTDETTVVVIDHTGKGAGRGSTPIGSQHKLSMVQGACIQVFPVDKPRRGGVGELELIVIKDRPGYVRQVAVGKDGQEVAACVTIDSRKEGETHMTVAPPADDTVTADLDTIDDRSLTRTLDSQIRADIEALLRAAPPEGMSGADMEKALRARGGEFSHERWTSALTAMLDGGVIEHNGKSTKGSAYSLRWP